MLYIRTKANGFIVGAGMNSNYLIICILMHFGKKSRFIAYLVVVEKALLLLIEETS